MLKNKVAFVTGSAKGLGSAIAQALAKQGATVIIHYLNSKTEAEATLKKVQEHSSDSILVQGDLTKEDEVQRIFEEIFSKLGKVDILVNGVGNFVYKPLSETNSDEFRDVIESNLYSAWYCMQEALPKMREQKYGRIINFGSAGCDQVQFFENTTPYYIAKTGLYALTKKLAREEIENNVTVNMISPGVLESSVVKYEMPGGRLVSFADITNALLFLLKEESSYISGTNLEVSGGWTPGQ